MELKDRIEQLRRLVEAIQRGNADGSERRPAPEPGRGGLGANGTPFDTVHTPSGSVKLAVCDLPLDHFHGGTELGAALRGRRDVLMALARETRPFPGFDRTAFIDVETTGLAGGAGTFAFLVGIGAFRGDSFRLHQFFLHDPAEERAMLEAVRDALGDAEAVVTFNGRCFDVPLLETRFAMCRLPCPLDEPFHLDLLPPSRRLWSGAIGECSLAAIERAVLGIDRGPDVPGWMIPAIYASYLRSADEAEIVPVVNHNRHDVLTLAALLARVCACMEPEPGSARRTAREALGAASAYESIGFHETAHSLYREALDSGRLEGGLRARALWGALRTARRLRDWRELLRYATALAASDTPDPEAWIELAKHYEHRAKDFRLAVRAALAAKRAIDSSPDIPAQRRLRLEQEIDHRLRRLQRRLRP